jgi:hypothetical protein
MDSLAARRRGIEREGPLLSALDIARPTRAPMEFTSSALMPSPGGFKLPAAPLVIMAMGRPGRVAVSAVAAPPHQSAETFRLMEPKATGCMA